MSVPTPWGTHWDTQQGGGRQLGTAWGPRLLQLPQATAPCVLTRPTHLEVTCATPERTSANHTPRPALSQKYIHSI